MKQLEGYRLRWVLDVEAEVSEGRFQEQLSLLPSPEQTQVLTFVQPMDKYRALASRLMQRCCVCLALGVEWRDVALALTKGRKPFTTNTKPPDAPNFNYNVSHEGRYVALASDPWHLVGVDVAAPRSLRPGAAASRPLNQHLQAFKGQLAASEWTLLQGHGHDEATQEAAFQRLWSLKEAYVKARGDGLGFHPLSRAAFQFPRDDPWAASAQLLLDGVPQPSWSFHLEALPHAHCVSVALGPVDAVVDEHGVFRRTLHATSPGVSRPEVAPSFQTVTLNGLLKASKAFR